MLKKKNLCQFSKNHRTFYPKNCHKALKNMGLGSGNRDPVSVKNLDPGSRGQKDAGSWIRIRNTAHCSLLHFFQAGLVSFCPWCAQACVENSRCGQMWAHILLVEPDENMPIPIVKSSCKLAQHRLGCPGCLGALCRWFEVICHH